MVPTWRSPWSASWATILPDEADHIVAAGRSSLDFGYLGASSYGIIASYAFLDTYLGGHSCYLSAVGRTGCQAGTW